MDPRRLDEELAHLLRSLEDLDGEHATGGLSDERYEQLRAQYTARTADVARAVDRAGAAARPRRPDRPRRLDRPHRLRTREAKPQPQTQTETQAPTQARPRRRRRRRLMAIVATLALGGLGATGAVAVLNSPPTAGQAAEPSSVAALRRAVQANPEDARAHDALADALAQNGDLAGALKEFDAAAAADPTDVVALSYSGWIAVLAGSPDKALDRLTRAEAVDPSYPDAHAFRGIALLRAGGDRAEATGELQRYLELTPDGPMAQQVRDVLDQLAPQP